MENSTIQMQLNSLNHFPWSDKDKELIKELIQKEHNVTNYRNENGETILHLAVKQNAYKIVKLLVEHGAPVNCWCNENHTPLHIAVHLDNFEISRILLEYGAYINTNCSCKITPLVHAINIHDLEMVNLLLKYNPNLNFISDGRLPLLYAVSQENEDIVEQLLRHGADVNSTAAYYTPLHLAVRLRNLKIVKILIANGAKVNALNSQGNTPLFSIVYYVLSRKEEKYWVNFEEIMTFLLDCRADINSKNNLSNTILHIAVLASNIKLTKILLKMGASMNVLNVEQKTPLSIAVSDDNEEMVALLLSYNSDINFEEHYVSPLHCVSDTGNVTILNMLLEHNPDVDNLFWEDETPLIKAIKERELVIIKRLLDFGANVDLKTVILNSEEITPLMAAIFIKDTEILNLLLAYGADVNLDCSGYFPLHIAIIVKNIKVLKSLLEHEPNVNANCPKGTPLHLTIQTDIDCLIKILLDLGADINIKMMPDGISVLKYAISKSRKLAIDIFLMKVLQLKASNMYIIPEILEDFNKEMMSRKTSYELELEKLKSKLIHANYKLTLYDICTQSADALSVVLQNYEIRNILQQTAEYGNSLKSFPKYVNLLKVNNNRVIRKVKLLERCHKLLRHILWNVKKRNVLPIEITMRIMNFLKDGEMNIFLNQFIC